MSPILRDFAVSAISTRMDTGAEAVRKVRVPMGSPR
jgi:hypothetical protein